MESAIEPDTLPSALVQASLSVCRFLCREVCFFLLWRGLILIDARWDILQYKLRIPIPPSNFLFCFPSLTPEWLFECFILGFILYQKVEHLSSAALRLVLRWEYVAGSHSATGVPRVEADWDQTLNLPPCPTPGPVRDRLQNIHATR